MVIVSLIVLFFGVIGYLVSINVIIPDNILFIPVIMALFGFMMFGVVVVVGFIGAMINGIWKCD